MYSLHALRHVWVLFSDILCQGLKLQEVPSLVSQFIFPWWWSCSSRRVYVLPSLQQQSPVILDGAWTLPCACASFFFNSVSNSCEPNKDPFAIAACSLCPSPVVLQSCKSLSLLTGVHFLLAAVMAWILGVLILEAWSPKRAWEVSSLQRGLF